MKKIIIPRRDHEVYFIPINEKLKRKQMQAFVMEQLDKLHPAFSADSAVDFKLLVFNNMRWLMVTVMEAETFAEYKILNKGAVFYTNTSIAVHNRDFTKNGTITLDDELIGYDVEKDTPISTPLDPEKEGISGKKVSYIKTIPAWYGVFVKKIPVWFFASIISAITVLLFFSLILVLNINKKVESSSIAVSIEPEPQPEIKYLPDPIEILSGISSDIVVKGGEIIRWNYNDDSEQLITIQLKGIDALATHDIFSQYEFVYPQDIQSISYSNGQPYITINLNAANNYYAAPSGSFPGQSAVLNMINEFTTALLKKGISIVSEVMPSGSSSFYTIAYTANNRELIGSFEILGDFSEKLRIKSIDISISGDSHTFTVLCTLAYFDTPDLAIESAENEKSGIPAAFGYKAYIPPAAPVVNLPEVKPEPPSIGSIRGGDSQIIFYRDADDGKIKTRVGDE
ncbi:MAG: hypothetical protein FWH41_10520 [Treponema sp.]|nr:hypothetical protein [Treponema sp.]